LYDSLLNSIIIIGNKMHEIFNSDSL